jgi:hypothetical protein
MTAFDQEKYAISPAHLASLTKWANSDPRSKAINLLIIQMIQEKVDRVIIVANRSECRVLVQRGDSSFKAEEWSPMPVDFEQIWRRLTLKSNSAPLPWWHQLPYWYWLSFRITERIDRWFWRPPLKGDGRMEFIVHNKPFVVSFKNTETDQIELTYSAALNEIN